MKNSLLYYILRPIVWVLFKILYWPKYKGLENIPKKGRVILASNHTNNLDCISLMCSTTRPVHFLAKVELFRGIKGILFNNMGLIPVDRQNKEGRHKAYENAIKYLESDKVIGIFPEGTVNKTENTILPFKMGAVRMSKETNTCIVPVIIKGKYRIFHKGLKIEFLKPVNINSDNVEEENRILENIFIKELED